jgi:hypothetical protein
VEPEPHEPKLFALAETEPECITVSAPKPVLGPDSTLNVKKSESNETPTFWEIMLLPILKRRDFVEKLSNYCPDPEP